MAWRLNNFIAVIVTVLAFAFCGWFIAGATGAAVSAALSLAMFLRPLSLREHSGPISSTTSRRSLSSPDLA